MMQKELPQSLIGRFIQTHQLPADFRALAERWYWPLARELERPVRAGTLNLLGISGCQGSGKSTLAAFFRCALSECANLSVASLSLDDFYLTRGERQELAETVHPLLKTRGVPGTHDLALARATIADLRSPGDEVWIPRFDKAADDRLPRAQWEAVQAPVDLVILEGWCLGVPPQSVLELSEPINDLEAAEDSRAVWRTYVNECLGGEYQALFAALDWLILLQAPGFDSVYQWRGRQEAQLAATVGEGSGQIMDRQALARFIQHYERLTRHALQNLPAKADTVFKLNAEQQIVERFNNREL